MAGRAVIPASPRRAWKGSPTLHESSGPARPHVLGLPMSHRVIPAEAMGTVDRVASGDLRRPGIQSGDPPEAVSEPGSSLNSSQVRPDHVIARVSPKARTKQSPGGVADRLLRRARVRRVLRCLRRLKAPLRTGLEPRPGSHRRVWNSTRTSLPSEGRLC